MISFLKQSTATTLLIGPIVDSTDASAETGQTIAQSDVLLWKEGGTTLGAKNESTSCTHRSNGLYTCPVDATDTNTLGVLTVNVAKSGTLVWRGNYAVVPAQVYNSLIAGSDALQVDATQINGSTAAATRQALAAGVILPGTVFDDAGTYAAVLTPATSLVFYSDDITEATADHYNGRVIIFTSGALLGQALSITDYEFVASTYGKFTTSASTEVPGNDATFIIV